MKASTSGVVRTISRRTFRQSAPCRRPLRLRWLAAISPRLPRRHRQHDLIFKQSTDIRSRTRGAMRPRFARILCPSRLRGAATLSEGAGDPQGRAQGKPGVRCTRSLACNVKSTRVSHHRFTGKSGFPCAMVLTVSFVLSLVTGLSCHHRPRDAQATSLQCDAKHRH